MEEAKQEGIEIGKKIAFTELENKQKEALEAFPSNHRQYQEKRNG